MIRDDEHWLQLTDAFHAAAFDPSQCHGELPGRQSQNGGMLPSAPCARRSKLGMAGVSRQVELVARLNQL